jgi:UDP-N-acetylmuramoylalanine--D-glutamate ligase
VLIAGGRNKDLDLSQMATEPSRIAGVVAIGEDAEIIARAFSGICPVRVATSMTQAVEDAAILVQEGETVLLSPGCTSYDWYKNYNERGDDFQSKVREHFSQHDRGV